MKCKGFLAVENPSGNPFYFVCRPMGEYCGKAREAVTMCLHWHMKAFKWIENFEVVDRSDDNEED